MDAQQHLATAYADSDATERNRRAVTEAAGKAWRWDAQMERLSLLAQAGHPISAELRMTLGFYERGKAAAKATGIDTRRPS